MKLYSPGVSSPRRRLAPVLLAGGAAFLVWLAVYAINGSVRDAQKQQRQYDMEASK